MSSSLFRCRPRRKLRCDLRRNGIRRGSNRIVRQVRIALGRLRLRIAEELPHHLEALPCGYGRAGKTVTQIMNSNIV